MNVNNIAIFNVIFLPSSTNTFHFHPQDYYDNPAIVETHSHVALDSTPSIHSPSVHPPSIHSPSIHPPSIHPPSIHSPMHVEEHLMSNKSSKFPTSYLPENKFQGVKLPTGSFQSSNVPKSNLRDSNLPSSYRHHHPRLPIRGVPASSNGQGQSRPVIDPDNHDMNQKTNHDMNQKTNHESNQKNNHESNQKTNHELNQETNHELNQEKVIKTKKRAPSSPGSKVHVKKKEIEKVEKVHHHIHEVSSKEEPEEEKSNPESDQGGKGRGPANEGRTKGGNLKHGYSGHDHPGSGKSKHDHSTGNGNQDQSEGEPEAPQVNVQVLSPEYTSEDYGNQYDTQDPSSGIDPQYHHNLRSYYDYHDPYAYHHHAHEPVSYRSEFYWLIPLVMIIGIGALLLPLCSLFMTTLASNGAVSLGGRRKRRKRAPGLNGIFFKENGHDWTGPLLDLKYTGLDIFTLFDDDGLSEQIDGLLTTLGKSIGME